MGFSRFATRVGINDKQLDIIAVLFVILISFVVHEIGHAIIGIALGYEIQGFGIGFLNGQPVLYVMLDQTSFIMRAAGGIIQALFILPFTQKYPELYEAASRKWRNETKSQLEH